MAEDICPYVFCTKCKGRDSWVRDKTRDIVGQESGEILWKGWRCKQCGESAIEPAGIIKSGVK